MKQKPSSNHTDRTKLNLQQSDHSDDLMYKPNNHNDQANLHTEQLQEQLALPEPDPAKSSFVQLQLRPRYRTRYGAWLCIFLLFAASLASVAWRGGAVEWLLLIVTSLVMLLSGVVPIISAAGLSYSRNISTALSEDGNVTIASKLNRVLCIPGVWFIVHEQHRNVSQMNKEPLSYRASFVPFFHRTMELEYRLSHVERGKFEALSTEIIVGDWLGLTSIAVNRHIAQSFAVLPAIQHPTEESYVTHYAVNRWKERQFINNDTNTKQDTNRDLSDIQYNDDYGNARDILHSDIQSEQTRPFIEGDSYRRLDVRAAARGRGWHTRLGEETEFETKQCIIIDQYALPYQDTIRNQLFESIIVWSIAEVYEQGKQQAVAVLTDDWTFEYDTAEKSYELRCLLSLAKADVELRMKDRLSQLSLLLPQNGYITVFTGDWREQDSWIALAEIAWSKGCTLVIHFATSNRVMTYAMREQQKILEQAGIKLIWRYCAPTAVGSINAIEGSERYATS